MNNNMDVKEISVDIFEMCKYRYLSRVNDIEEFNYTCHCSEAVPQGQSYTECNILKCPFIHIKYY